MCVLPAKLIVDLHSINYRGTVIVKTQLPPLLLEWKNLATKWKSSRSPWTMIRILTKIRNTNQWKSISWTAVGLRNITSTKMSTPHIRARLHELTHRNTEARLFFSFRMRMRRALQGWTLLTPKNRNLPWIGRPHQFQPVISLSHPSTWERPFPILHLTSSPPLPLVKPMFGIETWKRSSSVWQTRLTLLGLTGTWITQYVSEIWISCCHLLFLSFLSFMLSLSLCQSRNFHMLRCPWNPRSARLISHSIAHLHVRVCAILQTWLQRMDTSKCLSWYSSRWKASARSSRQKC